MSYFVPERIRTKRQQQAVDTKNALMLASRKLFADHGYDEVTVDDICAACGVSKGAFYHHFKTKAELCNRMFVFSIEAHVREVLAPYLDTDNTTELFLRFMQTVLSYDCGMSLDFARDNFTRGFAVGGFMGDIVEESLPNTFSTIVAKGREKGDLRPDLDDLFCIRYLTIQMQGMQLLWSQNKEPFASGNVEPFVRAALSAITVTSDE